MKGRRSHKGKVRWLVILAGCALTVLLAGRAEALNAIYNRPEPFMDYVPQVLGIYDTTYDNFTDADCADCHGSPTYELHHLTGPALANECIVCHPPSPYPPPPIPGCTDASCHGIDINPDNPWHHNSDAATSGQCTACHRGDMIGALRGSPQPLYYPSGVAPTPFRCENCHWPTTELSPPVDGPFYLHHMGMMGMAASDCSSCHAIASNAPNWDPYDPTLVRSCENCHTRDSLHAVSAHQPNDRCYGCHSFDMMAMPTPEPRPPAIGSVSPHSGSNTTISGSNFGSPGPEAWIVLTPRVGDTSGSRTPVIVPSTDPGVSAWNDESITVQLPGTSPSGNYDLQVRTATGLSNRALFTLSGTAATAPPVPGTPAITSAGPTLGAEYTVVTIEGTDFGDRHCCGRDVFLRLADDSYEAALGIKTWTDTMIVARVPVWMFWPDSYELFVRNESGDSNAVGFTVRATPGSVSLALDGLALTVSGTGYGALPEEVLGGYGYSSAVKFGSRSHTYKATHITSWTDTQIDLVMDSFEDETGASTSALPEGEYGVVVETAYFEDVNLNGELDPADEVYQAFTSELVQLKLGEATTLPGSYVSYSSPEASMVFEEVTAAGDTTVAPHPSPPPVPSGFQVLGTCYDVTTTATYSGQVKVCFNYEDCPDDCLTPEEEANIRLLHWEGDPGSWVDVTSSLSTKTNTVCGLVTILSPFVAGVSTNSPPVANAGPDQAVECGSPVTLDGSGSSDPNGDVLTYTWTGPFGTATGVTPTVSLPLGTSTISLVVNDGQLDSAPDTVEVTVTVGVEGLQSPLAALVPEGEPVPMPQKAFNQGRTLPLKLQLFCGEAAQTDQDVSPPEIVSLVREGDALDLETIDLDAGQANDSGPFFRFEDCHWIYNLSTRDLGSGTYVITLEMPDGQRWATGFVLR